MTTRLAAVRRGDLGAFRAMLVEHGAALEHLARGLDALARLDVLVLRVWKDAALVDATADERAFVVTTAARDLARATLPASMRLRPETDAANIVWHLARGLTGIGDDLDLEIVADATRGDDELLALAERWRGLVEGALRHPAGAPSDPNLWDRVEPRLR